MPLLVLPGLWKGAKPKAPTTHAQVSLSPDDKDELELVEESGAVKIYQRTAGGTRNLWAQNCKVVIRGDHLDSGRTFELKVDYSSPRKHTGELGSIVAATWEADEGP